MTGVEDVETVSWKLRSLTRKRKIEGHVFYLAERGDWFFRKKKKKRKIVKSEKKG